MAMKATFMAIENKEYRCGECLSKYRGRADEEQMVERSTKSKFCETPAPRPFVAYEKEIYFSRCPGNYFSHSAIQLMRAHDAYERGVMPFTGSLFDQPNKVMEAFSLVEEYKARRQEKAAAAHRQSASRTRTVKRGR